MSSPRTSGLKDDFQPLPIRRVRRDDTDRRGPLGPSAAGKGTPNVSAYHYSHPHQHGRRGVHEHRHGHRGTAPSRWPASPPWHHVFAEHAHVHGDRRTRPRWRLRQRQDGKAMAAMRSPLCRMNQRPEVEALVPAREPPGAGCRRQSGDTRAPTYGHSGGSGGHGAMAHRYVPRLEVETLGPRAGSSSTCGTRAVATALFRW